MTVDRITLEEWDRRAAAARQVTDDPSAGGEAPGARAAPDPRYFPAFLHQEPDPWWDRRRRARRQRITLAAAGFVVVAAVLLVGFLR